jgi:putative glycerol-1-phosphate prenyltransferase
MRNKDRNIYDQVRQAENEKLLAILLDPDKIVWENLDHLILKSSNHRPIFSLAEASETNIIDELIIRLKHKVKLPMVLFPGNPDFSRSRCHFVSFLISGRNGLPNRVSGKSSILKRTQLEIIPMVIFLESGNETAVGRISKTEPLDRTNFELVLATAQAGEMLGNKLIYLEGVVALNRQFL